MACDINHLHMLQINSQHAAMKYAELWGIPWGGGGGGRIDIMCACHAKFSHN
jgi:hypothetical protein